jgi:hypothetical protein
MRDRCDWLESLVWLLFGVVLAIVGYILSH